MTRDHGPQPLNGLMVRWGITNHELVEVSEEKLKHKQVQKGRAGFAPLIEALAITVA